MLPFSRGAFYDFVSEPAENHYRSWDTLCQRRRRAQTCRSECARAGRVERWRLGRRARRTRAYLEVMIRRDRLP